MLKKNQYNLSFTNRNFQIVVVKLLFQEGYASLKLEFFPANFNTLVTPSLYHFVLLKVILLQLINQKLLK